MIEHKPVCLQASAPVIAGIVEDECLCDAARKAELESNDLSLAKLCAVVFELNSEVEPGGIVRVTTAAEAVERAVELAEARRAGAAK